MDVAAPLISGLLFCEFDNISGPKVTFQFPENLITADQFRSVSDYIITKPALAGKPTTVLIDDFKLMGFCVCIDDEKYPRNALLFNFCFVFDKEIPDTLLQQYKPLTIKLADCFIALETERGYIFQPEQKKNILNILPQIQDQLNQDGICKIAVNESHELFLQLNPPLPAIENHDVPEYLVVIPLYDDLADIFQNDPSLYPIVLAIDGKRTVRQISDESHINPAQVRKAIRSLRIFGLIFLIPPIYGTNRYLVTSKLHSFWKTDEAIRSECCQYVAKQNQRVEFANIFRLYSQVTAHYDLKAFCDTFRLDEENVDERKFIIYGLLNGIVLPVVIQSASGFD